MVENVIGLRPFGLRFIACRFVFKIDIAGCTTWLVSSMIEAFKSRISERANMFFFNWTICLFFFHCGYFLVRLDCVIVMEIIKEKCWM